MYVLVGGKLGVLTNNHVLPDKQLASVAVATFQVHPQQASIATAQRDRERQRQVHPQQASIATAL
jgi:hypothetical protein